VIAKHRVHEVAKNQFWVEQGLEYDDGYRVTVGWSDEDNAWIARCSGLSTGDALADGPTREAALLDLACSLAATVDAVNPDVEAA
jgi:hypothetical protein